MHYTVMLQGGTVNDCILPGLIPDRVFDLMEVRVVDELGLCENCSLDTSCHVMRLIEKPHPSPEQDWFDKLCPVLFHDVVKPRWKLEKLL